MNAKKLVVLAVAVGLFAISPTVHAQMHTNAGFVSHAGTSHAVVRPGTGAWGGSNWHGGDWHHHHGNSTIFIGGFGFPFWGWGWGYPIGYPYGYGYGYPYGGYYPPPYYGSGYYGSGYYGGGYYGGGGYSGSSYGPVYPSYAYGSGSGSQSNVVRLQQRLARTGYYRGPIDGIMGSRTRYALRAYEHDHGAGTDRMTDQ